MEVFKGMVGQAFIHIQTLSLERELNTVHFLMLQIFQSQWSLFLDLIPTKGTNQDKGSTKKEW